MQAEKTSAAAAGFAVGAAHVVERRSHTFTVVGRPSADRSRLIKAFARKGAEVQLRKLSQSERSQSIGVWVRCVRFWGLWKTWAHIGFLVPDPAKPFAPVNEIGSARIVKAWVHSSYAPLESEMPQVCLRVVFETKIVEQQRALG